MYKSRFMGNPCKKYWHRVQSIISTFVARPHIKPVYLSWMHPLIYQNHVMWAFGQHSPFIERHWRIQIGSKLTGDIASTCSRKLFTWCRWKITMGFRDSFFFFTVHLSVRNHRDNFGTGRAGMARSASVAIERRGAGCWSSLRHVLGIMHL